MYIATQCIQELLVRLLMARTLMAHSPSLARTIIMVHTGNFMHNLPWMHGWLELLFFMVPWKPFRAIEALLYPDQLALSEAIQ